MKKYVVELTPEQREELSRMISTGKDAARELTHARILLKADQGPQGPAWSDSRIEEALEVSESQVQRVRKSCAQHGVQEAIVPQAVSRARRRRLDGEQEAYLIALACSTPPEGCVRWTLRLLAHTLVELGYVETVSHETVRQVLLANELKFWTKKQWCIPTQADAEFVYHMEDVLEVYTRPYDPKRPQVCMDEINTQLLSCPWPVAYGTWPANGRRLRICARGCVQRVSGLRTAFRQTLYDGGRESHQAGVGAVHPQTLRCVLSHR